MRKRTNSMTELCKDIAREQFEEQLNSLVLNIRDVSAKECNRIMNQHIRADHAEMGVGPRSGDRWERSEDNMLETSLECMINMLAVQHGRSATAIRCRLRDKLFS